MQFSVKNAQLLKHRIAVLCTEGVNKGINTCKAGSNPTSVTEQTTIKNNFTRNFALYEPRFKAEIYLPKLKFTLKANSTEKS